MDAMETRLVTPCRAKVSGREVALSKGCSGFTCHVSPARFEAPAAVWEWFGSQGTDNPGFSVAFGGELTRSSKLQAVLPAKLLESL